MSAALTSLLEEPPLPPPSVARRIRVQAGLRQQDLALELGVSERSVVRWEKGQVAPMDLHRSRYVAMLYRLAEQAG